MTAGRIADWEFVAQCAPSDAHPVPILCRAHSNSSSELRSFINGEGPEADRARNKQFKLIPHISKGAWIMQKSVGTTPVILGQKLTTKYFK